jgi:Ca2+-binding EF-hand superfamily protein
MGMPAQNQAIPSMGSMQSMNSQPMGTQAMPMMTNAMPGMMAQNIPQGQVIQQGQPMPLMASQIGHNNIPMGQPLNPNNIPTGLAGNRDREWLLQYGNPNPDEMFLLREWFGTVDQDKTGQIDVIKLQTALSASGEKFGENIYFLMIKMFDVDGSHSINFLEFAQLYKFIRSMRSAFESVDVNRSNLITLQQVQQALGAAGFNGIPPQYAALLFRKFDRNKRQKLSFENFMEMCVILGHTKSWFIAKDTDLDGKVTLSLFELFELISYC